MAHGLSAINELQLLTIHQIVFIAYFCGTVSLQ